LEQILHLNGPLVRGRRRGSDHHDRQHRQAKANIHKAPRVGRRYTSGGQAANDMDLKPITFLTLSPLGRGWFASVASKPGEGLYLHHKTPHPPSRIREMAASPQRGEAGAGWFPVIACLTLFVR